MKGAPTNRHTHIPDGNSHANKDKHIDKDESTQIVFLVSPVIYQVTTGASFMAQWVKPLTPCNVRVPYGLQLQVNVSVFFELI